MSKPVYSPLAADAGGRYHLLLGVGAGVVCLHRVLRELRDSVSDFPEDEPAAPPRIEVLFAHAHTQVADGFAQAAATRDPFADMGVDAVTLFDDALALLEAARRVLDTSRMGTRLYIAGPESFIGRALQVALEFNLNKDEIRAEHIGSTARRVHCVHCRADTEEVRTNIVRCAGCDRWLQVRDHYSRRFAAYMGVMADAEVPGELPPVHEIHP